MRARRLLKAKNRVKGEKQVKTDPVVIKKKRGRKPGATSNRNREMADIFLKKPVSLEELGVKYGLTRERVRQLLYKMGIENKDGAFYKHKTAKKMSEGAKAAKNRAAKANKSCMSYLDCTSDIFFDLTGIKWTSLALAGRLAKAYFNQKHSADIRGISWELTFPKWFDIWNRSGHIDQRGKGQEKYVMARKYDIGPYSEDNVYICLSTENNSERNDKKSELPMGVTKTRNGKFAASKMVEGKKHHIGTFSSVNEASDAYQQFTGKNK